MYEVPTDPKDYGATDSLPIFDSGELPGAPFFQRFSPDDESLVMLCYSPANETGDPYTALVMMEWGKYHRKDSWAGQAAVARFAPRKVLTLMKGSSVFFTHTTSSPSNATIVAHCEKEVQDPITKSMVNEKAVWLLQRQDTGGVQDNSWLKVSDSASTDKWSTPICHSAGGGDSVLVVEDGYLVSKAISRWKRDDNGGALLSKKIMKVRGDVKFLVSPDNSRAVVMQEDVSNGYYSLTVIDGEDALDPSSTGTGNQYEIPNPKLTVAFWFSPDSTKILLLTTASKSKDEVIFQRNSMRSLIESDMQYTVFNFPLQELREYDTFKPTPYFVVTYVPYFSQYAQVIFITLYYMYLYLNISDIHTHDLRGLNVLHLCFQSYGFDSFNFKKPLSQYFFFSLLSNRHTILGHQTQEVSCM